jgi:hypothetical protein
MFVDWYRFAKDLISRVTGPLHFRLVMQPAMAAFFGIRDGLKDARKDRPLYFRALYTGQGPRIELLKMGFRSVAKIFILAIVLDAIYQAIAEHRFYPGEALVVAFVLAFIPYVLIRGPANRIARWRRSSGKSTDRQMPFKKAS